MSEATTLNTEAHNSAGPTTVGAEAAGHELVLERVMDVSRDKLYRCWTETELLKQWFCPKPWIVSYAAFDVRPGGASLVVMKSPDGEEFANPGVFLDVVENERLVMTDAYTSAWVPSQKPFMTAIVTFEDIGGGRTRYVARAVHWSAEDKATHEAMGFHEGWGKAADQLEDVAKAL